MKFGSSYSTIPNPSMRIVEYRLQQPIISSNLDEVYHHVLFDKYRRPSAGHIGKYCLNDFIKTAVGNSQELIITLNFRNDSGDKNSFTLRPPEEFKKVAQVIPRLKKDYPKLNFKVNLFNEFFYRYKKSWQDAIPYIDVVKPELARYGILLGGLGDEYITQAQRNGLSALKDRLDFLTPHFLYTPVSELSYVYQVKNEPLYILETGSQTKDYRTSSGFTYIKYLLDSFVLNEEKISGACFIYVDSNYPGDANYTMRMWNSDYTTVISTTNTYDLFLDYVKEWDMQYYNRPLDLQAVHDAFGWKFPYNWELPNLPVAGKKDPTGIVSWADIDALMETQYKSLIYALKKSGALPPQFPDYPDIKYINGIWNVKWRDKARENPIEL